MPSFDGAFSSTDVCQSFVIVVVIIVIIIIKTNVKFPCSLPFSARKSAGVGAQCNAVKMHITSSVIQRFHCKWQERK